MSSVILKACPFCGGKAQYDDNQCAHYGLDVPGVECTVCDVRNFVTVTVVGSTAIDYAASKADAIKQWNCSEFNYQVKIDELEMHIQMTSDNQEDEIKIIRQCKESIQLIYSHCGEDELVQQTFDPLLQNTLNIY